MNKDNARQLKPFSSLCNTRRHELLAQIKAHIIKSAQGDSLEKILPVLLSYLKFSDYLSYEINEPFQAVVQNIIKLHNDSPKEYQPALKALVVNQFSFKKLSELGMDISASQYKYCRQQNKVKDFKLTGFVRYVPESKRKKPIEIVEKIINICLQFSEVGPEVYTQKLNEDCQTISNSIDNLYSTKKTYYLAITLNEIYGLLKADTPDLQLGRSTFYKIVPDNFKVAKKHTK